MKHTQFVAILYAGSIRTTDIHGFLSGMRHPVSIKDQQFSPVYEL